VKREKAKGPPYTYGKPTKNISREKQKRGIFKYIEECSEPRIED